jgi:hypothetical protein
MIGKETGRILETTDERLAAKILPRLGRFIVLYYNGDSSVGRDQKAELEQFLKMTNRKALAINVRGHNESDPRPVRLTHLPTMAVFQDGKAVKTAEGFIPFDRIGKHLS